MYVHVTLLWLLTRVSLFQQVSFEWCYGVFSPLFCLLKPQLVEADGHASWVWFCQRFLSWSPDSFNLKSVVLSCPVLFWNIDLSFQITCPSSRVTCLCVPLITQVCSPVPLGSSCVYSLCLPLSRGQFVVLPCRQYSCLKTWTSEPEPVFIIIPRASDASFAPSEFSFDIVNFCCSCIYPRAWSWVFLLQSFCLSSKYFSVFKACFVSSVQEWFWFVNVS